MLQFKVALKQIPESLAVLHKNHARKPHAVEHIYFPINIDGQAKIGGSNKKERTKRLNGGPFMSPSSICSYWCV
jgi:hypothetical protein